ncbi:MAG: alpha/beta hydrolase [Algoriphagus sp.]|nr:alpha/beta hydrolase [Algoriphagus sp.]
MSTLETPWGRLFFEQMGDGPEVFLVFHGFGQTHLDMMPFASLIQPGQRFLFFDMFLHGKSSWHDSSVLLTKVIWSKIVHEILSQEGFTDFHIVGYSMGGKFSLLTYELFPEKVKSLILLAPDGIKTGIFYNLNSYPSYFHPFFKRVVFKPQRFFGIMEGLHSVGILETSLIKFVKTQMQTRSKRAQVYLTWKVFGDIQLSLGSIIQLARKVKTPITLFTGKFDKMVTAENLKPFSTKIPHLKSVSLPVGHGKLIEAAVEYLNQGLGKRV